MSINRVSISGNLTRDPKLRQTQGVTAILSLGVAVNDRRRNPSTGEWEDYPNFVDCVVFGSRCDFLSKNLRKGKKVHIEGKLRYSSWEKDGQRRSKIEVVVDDIDFELPPKQQAAPQGYPPQAAPQYPPQQAYQQQQAYQLQGYPQQYQQPPQGYQQPAQAPQQQRQAPQAATYPQQQRQAPQQVPQQAPRQVQQQPQQQQMQQPPQTVDVYDEDIPL